MGACLRCCYKCVDYEPINEHAVDLSHFTLHRVLGRGGFGKVSVAESRLNGELFAIKAMSKRWLLQSASNVKSVWLERHIMIQVRSNFLVHTAYAFQDAENIYLVMKFLPGGDLHYLLYQGNQLTGTKNQEAPGAKPLPEDHVRFYMVEILLGLEEMHSVGLVYRDLKPENVLLDEQGHVYLSDFGLAGDLNAEADGLTVGACGTPGYQARELLSNHPYDFTPDVYAFGVVMYELLHGGVPGLYEDPRQLRFRSNLSSACIDLLVQLLQHDPNARLGCDIQRTHRWNDIKAHSFFSKVNWDRAQRKAIRPPFKPLADTANCDPMYELEEQLRETPAVQPQPLSEKEQAVFKGWEYHTDIVYHSKDHFFEPNEQSVFSLSSAGGNNSAGASSQQPASISPSGVALLAGNKVGASSMSPSFTHSRNPTTEMSILVRPSETARDKDDSASSARSKHLSEEEKAEVERAALAAAAAASLISSHPTQGPPSRNKPSRQGQSQTKSNQMGGGAVVHVQPKAVDLHAVRVAMPDEDIKEGNEEEE